MTNEMRPSILGAESTIIAERRPDLLLIGAQKCATTWLYLCLAEHPTIYCPPHKREREYLGSPIYSGRGSSAYWSLFAPAKPFQITADASVNYLSDPDSAKRLAAELPGVRLLVSLRHPVERAISACEWLKRRAVIPDESIDQAIQKVVDRIGRDDTERSDDPYVDIYHRGRYAVQLRAYTEHFDPAQIRVIVYDDIVARSRQIVAGIYSFAGVNPEFVPQSITARPKLASRSHWITSLERAIRGSGDRPPGIPTRAAYRFLHELNRHLPRAAADTKPPLDARLHRALSDAYAEDIAQLQELLDGLAILGRSATPRLVDLWQ